MSLLLAESIPGPDWAVAWARWYAAVAAENELALERERAFQIIAGRSGSFVVNPIKGLTFRFDTIAAAAGGIILTGDPRVRDSLEDSTAFNEIPVVKP